MKYMENSSKNDARIQTVNKLNEFYNYLSTLTLMIQKNPLSFDLENQLADVEKLYQSQEHKNADIFCTALASNLLRDRDKREALLTLPTGVYTLSGKIGHFYKHPLFTPVTSLGFGLLGLAIAAMWTAGRAYEIVSVATAAFLTSSLVIAALVFVTSTVVISLATKYLNSYIQKRKTERVENHLDDDAFHTTRLICSLLTLYSEEKLSKKELYPTEIKRLGKKECQRLMNNILKYKGSKDLPHCLADTLLCDFSFTELYALKVRESSLRYWLGALEQTIIEDKNSIGLDAFLKKINECKNTKVTTKIEHRISPQHVTTSANSSHFFSSQIKEVNRSEMCQTESHTMSVTS